MTPSLSSMRPTGQRRAMSSTGAVRRCRPRIPLSFIPATLSSLHSHPRMSASGHVSEPRRIVSDAPPIVLLLASEDWWCGWCDTLRPTRSEPGQWEPKFLELSAQLQVRLGIVIECIALQGIGLVDVTWDAHGPRLDKTPPMHRVRLDGTPLAAQRSASTNPRSEPAGSRA